MKFISYNVNGIRAAIQKGFIDWLKVENPDIICLQELKAEIDQVNLTDIEALGYQIYWHSAQKKGYSGVAIFSKIQPKHVEIGCGIEKYDSEGRVIRLDFETFSIMSVYMPSGSSGDDRQAFKMEWLSDFHAYAQDLISKIPHLIISGDYNICHKEIDIHNPKSNANSSGFLPEEREWLENFIQTGFIDTFRHINPDPHHYSWWSYRAGARGKNLGWRIDYHLATKALENRIAHAEILPQIYHSDHCPIVLEIN
ncbi:exodeoxyribonuclease III [Aquirufa sp. ROCK2-A2]